MACVALKRPLELEPLHKPEGVKRSRLSSYRPGPSASSPSIGASSSPLPTQGAMGGAAPSLSQEQLQSYLRAEIKHLRRRKLLPARRGEREAGRAERTTECPRSPPRSGSSSEDDGPSAASVRPRPSAADKDKAFSLSQVSQICQRLLTEQEERLRQHFEAILHHKLTEQYETFVRFTHDQIHRRAANDDVPSYLS